MNTTATINSSSMSNRIAAGVTAEYLLDLTRTPQGARLRPGHARARTVARRGTVGTQRTSRR